MFQRLFKAVPDIRETCTVYICTRLAVICEDSSDYHTSKYLDVALESLNTWEPKLMFLEEYKATDSMHKKGTSWCVYEASVPLHFIQQTDHPDGHVLLENYLFCSKDIKNMILHPLIAQMPGPTHSI